MTVNQKEPAIVFFDIETTLAQFWGFRLGDQKLGWEQIKKEPVVCAICWAVGDGEVKSSTFDLGLYDPDAYDDDSDYRILSKFVDIANSADLLVGHNGKAFDIGFMRGRLLKHELPDIAPVLIDDTYLKTKGIRTMSHKLGYMLKFLGLGEKVEHSGLDMWKRVGVGDKKALRDMVEYCKGDVEKVRQLYKRVRPYINSNLSLAVFYGMPDICPRCGGAGVTKRGFSYTAVSKRQRYQCVDCNWWGADGINLLAQVGKPTRPTKLIKR